MLKVWAMAMAISILSEALSMGQQVGYWNSTSRNVRLSNTSISPGSTQQICGCDSVFPSNMRILFLCCDGMTKKLSVNASETWRATPRQDHKNLVRCSNTRIFTVSQFCHLNIGPLINHYIPYMVNDTTNSNPPKKNPRAPYPESSCRWCPRDCPQRHRHGPSRPSSLWELPWDQKTADRLGQKLSGNSCDSSKSSWEPGKLKKLYTCIYIPEQAWACKIVKQCSVFLMYQHVCACKLPMKPKSNLHHHVHLLATQIWIK